MREGVLLFEHTSDLTFYVPGGMLLLVNSNIKSNVASLHIWPQQFQFITLYKVCTGTSIDGFLCVWCQKYLDYLASH